MSGIVSGITKTLFGGSDSKQRQESSNTSTAAPSFAVRRTPFSSFSGDSLTLDPTIRNLQLSAMSGYENLLPNLSSTTEMFKNAGDSAKTITGELRTNLGNIRSSFLGNSGALRQARLNPLREAIARRRGELTQSLGQRGLSGSSFGQQSLNNFELDAARQIGDVSAISEDDVLTKELYVLNKELDVLEKVTGIDKAILNAMIGKIQIESNLLGLPLNIAQQRLEQEINAFNFGKGTTSTSYGTGSAVGSSDTRGGLLSSYGGWTQQKR